MTLSLIGLAFIVVPVAEIALFILVGQQIGLWLTLAGIFITAILGAGLLRHQGLYTLREAQARLSRGEAPVQQLFDGLCLFAAGAFLLTPGFLTDIAGFFLLVPGFRQVLGAAFWRLLQRRGMVMHTGMHPPGHGTRSGVVDVDYQVVDPPDAGPSTEPPPDLEPGQRPGPPRRTPSNSMPRGGKPPGPSQP